MIDRRKNLSTSVEMPLVNPKSDAAVASATSTSNLHYSRRYLSRLQYQRLFYVFGIFFLGLFGVFHIIKSDGKNVVEKRFRDALKQTSRLSIDTSAPKERKLVLVATLGNPQNTNLVRYNIDTHFADWECIMFSYVSEEKLPDPPSHCGVVRLLGASWSEFFGRIPMAAIRSRYDYVAVLLDDVYLPRYGENPVNVTKLLTTMKRHDLASISPAIDGSHWEPTKPHLLPPDSKHESLGVMEVPAIETFAQLFNAESFSCWQSLHGRFRSNRQASCIDVCFKSLCSKGQGQADSNWKLGVDNRMVAFHSTEVAVPEDALPEDSDIYDLRDSLIWYHDFHQRVLRKKQKKSMKKYCKTNYCTAYDDAKYFLPSSALFLDDTASDPP